MYKYNLSREANWEERMKVQALYNYKSDQRCDLEFRRGQVSNPKKHWHSFTYRQLLFVQNAYRAMYSPTKRGKGEFSLPTAGISASEETKS